MITVAARCSFSPVVAITVRRCLVSRAMDCGAPGLGLIARYGDLHRKEAPLACTCRRLAGFIGMQELASASRSTC